MCIFFVGISFSSNILAKDDNNKVANMYFKDNYGVDDNSASFKAYGLWSIINNKETDWPALKIDPTTNKPLLSKDNQKDLVNLIDFGFGAGMSFTTFFTNYIGVEFGVSGILYKINKDELINVQFNYTNMGNPTPTLTPTPTPTPTKNDNVMLIDQNQTPSTLSTDDYIYSIPFHATLQFYMAPFGGIRPYVGGGYHINYVYSPLKEISIDFMHGPIIQAGIDFVGKDDTIYYIDIKKYFVTNAKINYNQGYFGDKAFSTKTDFSPIIISLGIGFKF